MNQLSMFEEERIDFGPKFGTRSLLKSALQKNIRRCRPWSAVRCAKALMVHDDGLKQLARRILIIMFEDCVLHPALPWGVGFMKVAARKSYQPNHEDLDRLMKLVWDLAAIGIRDAHELHSKVDEAWAPRKGLVGRSSEMVEAIAGVAVTCGKMDKWIWHYVHLWTKRFDENDKWLADVDAFYEGLPPAPSFRDVGQLQPEDIPLAAVDMHCSPLIKILVKKGWVHEASVNIFGSGVGVEKIVDAAIWCCRSSVNDKGDICRDYKTFSEMDWCGVIGKEQKVSPQGIYGLYAQIAAEADSISHWYLEKKNLR